MRIVELEKYKAVRRKLSLYNGIYYGVPVGLAVVILTFSSGFFEALLFGLIVGGVVFALIYFLRELTHKGVESKRNKLQLKGTRLDVSLKGEMGVLEILDNSLIFHNLTPGGYEKKQEWLISNDLFMGTGNIIHTIIQKMKHHSITEGYVFLKEMPNGTPFQLVFYNIDNTFEKVSDLIQNITKYEEQ